MGSCEKYIVNQKKYSLDRMRTVWRKDDYRIAWFHLINRQFVYMIAPVKLVEFISVIKRPHRRSHLRRCVSEILQI
jgi:hypothetical protein